MSDISYKSALLSYSQQLALQVHSPVSWLTRFHTWTESVEKLDGRQCSHLPHQAIRVNRVADASRYSRWIFILEGLFTIAFGIFSLFVMPQTPGTASFLTHEERFATLEMLRANQNGEGDVEPFSWREVWSVTKSPQAMLMLPGFFANGMRRPSAPHAVCASHLTSRYDSRCHTVRTSLLVSRSAHFR